MRVYDSDNTPLLDALKEISSGPYIVVFTDDDTASNISGHDISMADRAISIVLEVGIASRVELPGADGSPPQPALELPATDEAMEIVIDIVEMQAKRALWQDTTNAWGDLLKEIVLGIRRVPSMRGAQADKGTRYAARQTTFIAENVIADPIPGMTLEAYHPVTKFLALARSDVNAAIATAADIIERALLTDPTANWRQAQSWLGLTEQAARAMGIAPLVQVVPDEEGAMLTDDDQGVQLEPQEPYEPYPKGQG
jgi:hypothetical protein